MRLDEREGGREITRRPVFDEMEVATVLGNYEKKLELEREIKTEPSFH